MAEFAEFTVFHPAILAFSAVKKITMEKAHD
jgi:hypothetical protein